jgi:hypothetical protein
VQFAAASSRTPPTLLPTSSKTSSPSSSLVQRAAPARFASSAISIKPSGELAVPDEPIIPFIEGDGTGPDIWRASVRVFDEAVKKAYGGKRKIDVRRVEERAWRTR